MNFFKLLINSLPVETISGKSKDEVTKWVIKNRRKQMTKRELRNFKVVPLS